jgi:hypothetical protein
MPKISIEEYKANAAYFSYEGNYRKHAGFINQYLSEKYGVDDIEDVPLEKRFELTKTLLLALSDEVHEVLGELPWKPWKTNHGDMSEVNEEDLKMEIVDVAHFVNNLIMVWFKDFAEFNAMFAAKLEENIDRQERNY